MMMRGSLRMAKPISVEGPVDTSVTVLGSWPITVCEAGLINKKPIPKNPTNAWLVAEHMKRFNSPPDFFTADGMSAAMAAITALEKTKGVTDTETMIAAMEGMEFQTPKGRMLFRKEDHQALQSMYGFRITVDPAVAWAVPVLTHEFTLDEIKLPIANKR